MTAEEIFKTMQDLIAEQFAIDAEEITMDSSFVDDLGADSALKKWKTTIEQNTVKRRFYYARKC